MGKTLSGSPDIRLLELLQLETALRHSSSELAVQLPDLFDEMSPEAVPRCRALLDGGLWFRSDSSAADLRSLVFEDLELQDQQRVLARIHATCVPPDPEQAGLVVLSDVDDTLLPGHDTLGISGSDRSWHLDGSLYPGVSRLHQELRNGLRDCYGGDYSLLLTARPPRLTRHLPEKFARITGVRNPRLGILPGEGGAKVAVNAVRCLTGNYRKLGVTKLTRMKEYALLFPDYAGRFVFIGDDGQADLAAAEQMLRLTTSIFRRMDGVPLLAFVAIKACVSDEGENVPAEVRDGIVDRMRKTYIPAPGGPSGAIRHRFFYFEDYLDLAGQLTVAGWIAQAQRDSVHRGILRDNVPDLDAIVRNCELEGLMAVLDKKKANCIEEGDEVEQEQFARCQKSLPIVAAAHLHVGAPPDGASELKLLAVSAKIGDVQWPERGWAFLRREKHTPRFTIWNPEAKVSSSIPALETVGGTELNLDWPNELLSGRRPVLDVALGAIIGRCYIVPKDEPAIDDIMATKPSGFEGDPSVVSASLIAFDSTGPDPTTRVGEVHIRASWEVDI